MRRPYCLPSASFPRLLHHELDLAFNKGNLDLDSMMHHRFFSFGANVHNLPYEIYFWKKNWRQIRINRIIQLPAQPLFSLSRRDNWSIEENELDAYIEGHSRHVEDGDGSAADDFAQHSSTS